MAVKPDFGPKVDIYGMKCTEPIGGRIPVAKELTRLPYVSAFLFCKKADCTLKSESADEDEDTSAGAK